LPRMPEASERERPVVHRVVDPWFLAVYDFASFIAEGFGNLARRRFDLHAVIDRCFELGVRTLPVVGLTGFITGIVFTQQSRPSLAEFGATSWLPALVMVAIVRSLAPLVTALVCAGKVGSSIGAELGSMKVTEQLDAMAVSAVNPHNHLVVPRTLATTITIPVLTMYFGLVAFVGAFLNVAANEGTSFRAFVDESVSAIEALDIASALFRGAVFGFTIGIVACYRGFRTTRGTRGVGRAANKAVVTSMILIFLEEVVIVQLINFVRMFQ